MMIAFGIWTIHHYENNLLRNCQRSNISYYGASAASCYLFISEIGEYVTVRTIGSYSYLTSESDSKSCINSDKILM